MGIDINKKEFSGVTNYYNRKNNNPKEKIKKIKHRLENTNV